MDNDTTEETDTSMEDISDSGDNGDFQLETDAQVQDAVTTLSENQEIQPDHWETLGEEERLNALQVVEDQMADIQGRESVPVVEDHDLGPGVYGGYNENDQSIHINSDHMMGDMPVEENVDTIVHEGRHAYQDYAINNPGVVNDTEIVNQWSENWREENYIRPENADFEDYVNQPVEADAWGYSRRIVDGIYGQRE
jgi:hypothetical protein